MTRRASAHRFGGMKTRPADAMRIDEGGASAARETLVVEAPLEIRVNGEPFSVTMRTPGEDRALARGLLHAEGILGEGCRPEYAAEADERTRLPRVVDLRVPTDAVLREFRGERALLSTSSCGLCGVRDATRLEMEMPPLPARDGEAVDARAIPALFDKMRAAQSAFDRSGGSHASAAFDAAGEMLACAEDVGRHNAVDKIVGALLDAEGLGRATTLLASGRLSYEIVFKAYRARIPVVLAVSAPSSLAVLTAERLGVTLAGFCRDGRATVYAHPSRVISVAGAG